MNWDESVEDIAAFLDAADADSLEIAKEIQAELRAAAQSVARPGRKNCGSCHTHTPHQAGSKANARIFPFKVHRGNQPYDKEHNTLLVPLLSGKDGYWTTLDWNRALGKGQESVGLHFSGRVFAKGNNAKNGKK